MTFVYHLLRTLVVLVLAAGPLVSSVQAAEDGQWSRVWANPFDGTVTPAEEEEPHHDDLKLGKEDATLTDVAYAVQVPAVVTRVILGETPPDPPYDGAPTPPPDAC